MTFQPNTVLERLKSGEDYSSSSNYDRLYSIFGFNPIFACKADTTKEILVNFLTTQTNYPQSLIIFESDNVVKINRLGWVKASTYGEPSELFIPGQSEYLVNTIEASSVKLLHTITDNPNPQAVQQEALKFMSKKPYKVINPALKSYTRANCRINIEKASSKHRLEFGEFLATLDSRPNQISQEAMDYFCSTLAPKFIQMVTIKKK